MEAPIAEDVAGCFCLHVHADRKRRLPTAQRDQGPIEREHRLGLSALRRDVSLPVFAREGQPWIAIGEAGVLAGIPLHRRALGITAKAEPRHVLLPRVAHALRRDWSVGHADLLALIAR